MSAQLKPEFSMRACGHRVPRGRKKCPYCKEPRLSVEPLRELLAQRIRHIGMHAASVEIATRLGMNFESVDRRIQRILCGETTTVSMSLADRYCVAIGGGDAMPATLWGQEWDDASPSEPYGDEDW